MKWLNTMKESRIAADTAKALERCLQDVPFVSLLNVTSEPLVGTVRAELLAKVALPEAEKLLVLEVKSSGEPRMIRDAANQLYRYRQACPDAYPIVVAPYISPRGAEICEQEGIGYLDLAGNCRLTFGQVYIRREGNPNPFAERRDLRSLYSPKAARVLRVLLEAPKKPWKLLDLKCEAGVSLGEVANVKKLLADREWIGTGAGGFWLAKPEDLLSEWSNSYDFRRRGESTTFYSLRSANEIEYDLAEACRQKGIRCVLTDFSGAARFAPMVRYQRASGYVDGAISDLAASLGLKPVSSGPNVILVVPRDDGVFYAAREFAQVPIASPIQLYLDLRQQPGRGEEAAAALLEGVIREQWQRNA